MMDVFSLPETHSDSYTTLYDITLQGGKYMRYIALHCINSKIPTKRKLKRPHLTAKYFQVLESCSRAKIRR